jgi:hypothetical protein
MGYPWIGAKVLISVWNGQVSLIYIRMLNLGQPESGGAGGAYNVISVPKMLNGLIWV